MLPITELRGAVPLYIIAYPEVHPLLIAGIAVVANTIPNFFILFLFPKLNDWLKNHSRTKSLIHWFTTKIHEKHGSKFARFGTVAILLIGSTPIPGAGSYTAAVLAFLFGVPYWKSMGLLFLGNIIAGVIVTAFATGIIHFSN